MPACGTFAAGDCPAAQADPGVFQITQASGGAGACAGRGFTISTLDAAQGKIQEAE